MIDSNLDNLTELETVSEDSDIEEDNSVSAGTNNNYLLIIIPATTILIVIVGAITDLQMDNLFLIETIAELLMVAEEHVYKSEVTASNLYG